MTGFTQVIISSLFASILQASTETILYSHRFLTMNHRLHQLMPSPRKYDLIADQDPSKGWAFCNRTKYKRIDLAVGFTIGSRRISTGWRSALKNNCHKPVDGDRPANLSYYAVAKDDQGRIIREWRGAANDKKYCLADDDIFRLILEAESPRPGNCKRLVSFVKIPKSELPIVTSDIK